jgi:hypothetical protein
MTRAFNLMKAFFALSLCLVPTFGQAQSAQRALCEIHQSYLQETVIPEASSGLPMEIVYATIEANVRDSGTRVVMKGVTRMAYRDPAVARKYVASGAFMGDCLRAGSAAR